MVKLHSSKMIGHIGIVVFVSLILLAEWLPLMSNLAELQCSELNSTWKDETCTETSTFIYKFTGLQNMCLYCDALSWKIMLISYAELSNLKDEIKHINTIH